MLNSFRRLTGFFVFILPLFAMAQLDSLPNKEFIFKQGKYFPQCHASTVIHLANGQFLVAWFAGSYEKHDDVGIWLSRQTKGKWDAPKEVAKIREEPHWNPVLFQAPGGRIYLYFKVGKQIPTWESWVQYSDDLGKTWSTAYELVSGDRGGRGPVKNKPIILSDGTWLAGASHEENGEHAFVDRSTDGGKTWTATPYLVNGDSALVNQRLIQPTLWESAPGQVHMLLRSSIGVICRSDSKDGGLTWSPVYKTSLGNPNSGIDLVKMPDGRLVLAYNPDTKDEGDRAPLLLAFSTDNGATWPIKILVENGPPEDEFSYPAIISFGDSIALTYTWQRRNMRFWTGSLKTLKIK